ncbi:MAG: ATP-dependent DNA ligase [Brooklawnia sp.]|jgi:bifunctional non-homologous end joining protein LigD
MAEGGSRVIVDGRAVRVTNLDKVMYPATGTTKGEVIAYYQEIAPWFLPHARHRIATRKRWPNGVGTPDQPQRPFFHKNLDPKSTPDWVATHTVQHSDGPNVYPLVDDTPTLVWLAQLASLEIHVPQWRVGPDGEHQHPNRLVLDLDPGQGAGMPQCVEVAHLVREVLDGTGFTSYPVTSGSKGIHLYAPLDGSMTSDEASTLARELARSLEALHPNLIVSDMKKELRKGKVLIDWSQNNAAKTTVAPYSLRGRDHPMVAAPRTWDELTPDVGQLDFNQILERARSGIGDLLAGLDGGSPASGPDRLATYRAMRDAHQTPEPVPADAPRPAAAGNSFVIQEHHARRLHHDFRLERDGVLASWALPKGPPTDPKTNHLAVQTEDHPLEYGSFAGEIPKGQYGAGQVSIWDAGSYELHKWVPGREVIVTLTGGPDGGLGGQPRTYALIYTGRDQDEKNWLIHLMTNPPAPDVPDLPVIEPMLATAGTAADVQGKGWIFEVKWDGYRAVASVGAGRASYRSRGGIDLTPAYPELAELGGLVSGNAVLDGEIVVLDSSGRPSFELLQNHARTPGRAHYMVFDLLHRDGQSLLRQPYSERRRQLHELLGAASQHIHLPVDLGEDAEVALAVSREQRLEGVVAKRADSVYQPGRRGRTWIKIKNVQSQAIVVVGWAPGENARTRTLGALLMAVPEGDELVYVGRVGSGFTEKELRDAREVLGEIETELAPVDGVPAAHAKGVRWVEPLLVGEVTYSERTDGSLLRHPVWKGWRPDLTAEDVGWEA